MLSAAYGKPSVWETFVNQVEATVLPQSKPQQRTFFDWLGAPSKAWPWDAPYLRAVHNAVNAVGDDGRLMLFLPPRHYKSQLVTVRYTAWRMTQEPALRCIIGCYNQTLAEKFSRQVRRFVRQDIMLSRERTAVDDWETMQGGGLRAVGVGGGVTGHGANLVVIDDPVKSREEANSEAYRDRCWDWFRDDIYTRLEPGASIILIMTRWHEDDLAGRILEEIPEGWDILRLPAISETQAERDEWAREHHQPLHQPDPIGRKPGLPLDPDRFPLAVLEEQRRVLGASFSALMQQRPQELQGGMFKRDDFLIVDGLPEDEPVLRSIVAIDKAGSDKAGDYTAIVLMCRTRRGLFYVLDVIRGQWEAGDREQKIIETVNDWHDLHGVRHVWLEQEPGSGGKESAQNTARSLARYVVEYALSTGDKATRAEPAAAGVGNGLVRLVRGRWNRELINELCTFPSGAHDDQVDAFSAGYNKLAALPLGERRVQRTGTV